MGEIWKENINVTTTPTKSAYIGKKKIIIEAPRKNTRLIHVALSYDYNGATFEDYIPLAPNEAKYFSAPKCKKIHYVKYYSDEGTQYVNYEASDGALSRTIVHDPDFEESESGLIPAYTFTTTDWETIKQFTLAWTDRAIRKYLRVKVKFSNVNVGGQGAEVRILQDDVDIESKNLVIPASGTNVIELYTRQPPLYNIHSTIKIQAKVGSLDVSVVADNDYSRWDVERRLATEELLRQEYSPNLCGVAIWNTPTMIPRFSKEDFEKAWNWGNLGGATTAPSISYIASGGYYGQNKLTIPNKIQITLMSNILYGHVNWLPMKWGIIPQAGADRSIGFDRPTFLDCACFWIKDDKFYAISKAFGHEQKTELTWNSDYAVTFHRYEICWYPNRVEFYIDETLQVVHWISTEFPSGLQFLNNDTISGNMEIASHFEIENMAGNYPIHAKAYRNIIAVASIAGAGEAHEDMNLRNVKELALTVKVTYHASATAGARVYLLASRGSGFTELDSENVTDAFAYFDLSFTAGATRQKTVNIDALPQYIRVLVRNLDGTNALTTVRVDVNIS